MLAPAQRAAGGCSPLKMIPDREPAAGENFSGPVQNRAGIGPERSGMVRNGPEYVLYVYPVSPPHFSRTSLIAFFSIPDRLFFGPYTKKRTNDIGVNMSGVELFDLFAMIEIEFCFEFFFSLKLLP